MRVITSVYLHLGMRGLRDEWLSGGDVDAVVEEAVPVECAWRGLVGWWHLRFYREEVEGLKILPQPEGGEEGGESEDGDGIVGEGERGEEKEDEYDFFARELEKMGWGLERGDGGGGEDEDEEMGEEDRGGSEWDGGPLRGEGWA